jgi:hypothetical protein
MKQLIVTVLAFLGITAFAKDKDGKLVLSGEQEAKLKESFGDDFTDKFSAALGKDPQGETTPAALTEDMFSALQTGVASLAAVQKDLTDVKAENERNKTQITNLNSTIVKLAGSPEDDTAVPPKKTIDMNTPWVPTGRDAFLFGEQTPFMALDDKHPYNLRAYSKLAEKHGLLIPAPRAASSLDYQSLKDDLGDFYRIRKQDRIQSFLMQLPSLANIFPLLSGYQDQAVLVNLFMDEFSQADGTALGSTFDNVVKGGYKFEPEVLSMYDVMFAHEFKQLKELEKNWLGYLNKEGSSTMKWSFIEYIMVETAKQLMNEQEIRCIQGVRKNPTLNVPGTAMQASNGLLKFIKNQISLFKVKPFALGEWTASSISNYIYNATSMIPQVIRDSGRLVLYMSSDAVVKYHKNNETLYGLVETYQPDIMFVKEYPNVKIVGIPQMGSSKRMIWTLDGNINLYEDTPGEMLNFNFEQRDWTLKVWANWRESIWINMVGKKFDSAAAMPSDYSTQMVFCNDVDEPADFFIPMDANDVTPSVLNHTSLVSVANSGATAITNFDDAQVGQQLIIKCGNANNPITIAAAGNFSLLTGAWTPGVGDMLYLKKRSDGKFIELKRTTVSSSAKAFTADDTTPDVTGDTNFITVANSVATAITNLDNALTDVVYTLYGGSNTNAATIANAGNFSLTAAMTLSAGTFIRLQKAENGKFYEISRG